MIDVAFTRAELRAADVAVVIDVLRATSTATQALAAGYRQVLCAASIETARSLRRTGRVLAGERHCLMPPGFDQGNSPLDAARVHGRDLVLATTNGAPAIVAAAAGARTVLLACLLNEDAVIARLRSVDGADIQLVCAGTDGSPALEDTYAAGRICAALRGPRTDAARVAEAVAYAYETPAGALSAGADAQVLRAAGMSADIVCCARVSQLGCVPEVSRTRAGVANVTVGAAAALAEVGLRAGGDPPTGTTIGVRGTVER
jgi:2-phosphosulfolactate phosphatase